MCPPPLVEIGLTDLPKMFTTKENCAGLSRAVARSENPGGHVVLGGDNVPPPPG